MALKDKVAKKKAVKEETAPETAPETTVPAERESAAAPAITGKDSVFIAEPGLVEICQIADWDTFPSISASSGTHLTNNKDDLGKTIEFQVIYQRPVWKMSANSNDDEATDYFQTSYEGEEELEEAKQEAIDAGYGKAGIKKYAEVFILVTKSENEDFIGEVFSLNLAPSSARNWKPLASRLKVKAAMKKLNTTEVIPDYPAVTFTSTAKPASWQGNNYTVFEFDIV